MDQGSQNDGLLSRCVQTAIGKIRGILKPQELINLVHQLHGRKNVLEVVKYFINDFNASKMEALIKQLHEAVRESYRSCLGDEKDIKVLKRLTERLEKVKNTPGAGTSEQMALCMFEENRVSQETLFLSPRIVAVISGVRGELSWNDMIKLLMQVRGRKSTMLEVVMSFTPNLSALLCQLQDIVEECNRCVCKEDSEKKDLQWMKQLIKRLEKCIQPASKETESLLMTTDQQVWSVMEAEEVSHETPFLSPRITAVVLKVGGELKSKDLLNFLVQVRGKKSATVVELINSSGWNYEALMNQLEDVVNQCTLYRFQEDEEKKDLQWMKQLIKRLDKCMEPASEGTKSYLTISDDCGPPLRPSAANFSSAMALTTTQCSVTKTKSAMGKCQSTVLQKTDQQAWSVMEAAEVRHETKFLSPRITAVVSKVGGELKSTDLLNFLVQVRGKKSATVVELINSSGWNYEALMNQLEDVVDQCTLYRFQEDEEKKDLQWMKQLIKRLDKCMEPTSEGTESYLTISDDCGPPLRHPLAANFSSDMALTTTQCSVTKTKSAMGKCQSTVLQKSYRTTLESTKKTKLQASKISTSSQSYSLLENKKKSTTKTTSKRLPKKQVSIQQMDDRNGYSNVLHMEQQTFRGATIDYRRV